MFPSLPPTALSSGHMFVEHSSSGGGGDVVSSPPPPFERFSSKSRGLKTVY